MRSALHAWPGRAMEPLWLAAAMLAPLVCNPWGANAFELPKALLLRGLALLMGLAALAQFLEEHGSPATMARRPARPLLWPALALGLAFAAATLTSANPRLSLLGSYERQQGLLTLVATLTLALLTAAHLRTRSQADRLWMALVWGSAPLVAYGLIQAAGLDPLAWRTDAASPVLATVGRANTFGTYLALVIPLTVGRLLIVRRRGSLAPLLIGQCLCAVFSQARGAWIGLGVGLLALGLTWASVTHNKKLAAVTLVAGLLAVGFVGLLNLPNGPVAALARQPGLARLAKLTNTREGSTAARLTIWQATLPLVAQRPWLGYGPETMRTVFARVYPPQLVYYQGRQVAVDRSHNLWLDLALSAGGAGLAAFLALLVGFCWLARRGLAGASDRWEATRWTALIAAVIGHLADVQFGFDSVASMTVFWLILALAATAPLPAAVAGERPEPAPQRSAWLPYIAPALLVLALIGLVCVRPLLADHAAWNSRQTIHAAQARQAEAERSVRLWPLEPEYRIGLAATYLDNGAPLAAEAQLAAADRLSPDDPQIWVAFGNLYAVWGEREPARFAQAEAAYRRGLALAPNVAAVHTALGLALVGQGRLHEGLIELERAVALDATDGVAYWRLAELYNMLGRPYDADQARKEAEILGR